MPQNKFYLSNSMFKVPSPFSTYTCQSNSDHKDYLISQLKNQIYDLRQLEAEFMRLNDQVIMLQQKYTLLLQEKERTQRQYKYSKFTSSKNQIDKISIIQLREQIDSLKIQIQKTSLQIEEHLRQNTALKRMSDARSNQIQAILSENRQIQGKNQRNNDQNQNLIINVQYFYQIKSLKQERNKIQNDCDRLLDILNKNFAILKGLQKDVRNSESDNARLDKTLLQAQNDNDHLNQQLIVKTQECRKADNKLNQLDDTIQQLKQNLKNLQILCQNNKFQASNHNINWQNEVARGKDLTAQLANLDNTIRNAQTNLAALHAQQEDARNKHFNLLDQNKYLNCQIDSCLAIINDYEQVNKQLINQIEDYIQGDQEAISILARRQIMRQLINKTTSKINATHKLIVHLKN